jgi:predicted phosphodiesterase
VKKYLIVPDAHFPFVDRASWRLLLKVGRAFKPDGIIVLGDFIDCYSISDFPKTRRMSIVDELASAREGIEDLEKLGAKKHHFIAGNHENRLPKHIAKHAPEIAGLVPSMRTLLGLERWTWTEYHDLLKVGRAWFTHDVGRCGPLAHIAAANDVGSNTAIGHTHHFGIEYRGNLKGSARFGSALGCLADRSQVDYAHKARVASWVHGCGLGYLMGDGDFHLALCPFVRSRAIVEGKEIRG